MTADTLHGRLLIAVDGHRDDPALHDGGVTRTYAELHDRCRAVAVAVAERTEPGDRVAMIAWNGEWWVEAYLGVPMAGRILTMVSPRLSITEFHDALDLAQPALVIVDEALVEGDIAQLAAPGRDVTSLDEWRRTVDDLSAVGPPIEPAADGDATAWLLFTSGTTGRPKAAALTHHNLLAAVDATETARPTPPGDVYLYPFPLWHVSGYNVLNRLLAGHQVVLEARFDAATILADIARFGATSMSVAATMLASILDAAEGDPVAMEALRTLREVYYGAAPMPSLLLGRALDLLGIDMWQGFGMTELSGNGAFLSADEHRRAHAGDESLRGATGRIGPGLEARIVGDDGNDVPAGERGELLLRGAQVIGGYWRDPEATAAALTVDGWLRTGDVGTLDADGLLRVLDRKKDIVITGGENVSAREVEEALRGHPNVADVAVIGVPDPVWGESVCAVIVASGAAPEPAELREFARTTLAGFKLPRYIAVCDTLPVNASGKVVKAELRTWLTRSPEQLRPAR